MYSGNAKNSIEALRSDGSTPTADVGIEDETEIAARRRSDEEIPFIQKKIRRLNAHVLTVCS